MLRRLLLNVDYTNGGDFYFDSYIKNKVYAIDDKNLHKEINKILLDEGAEMLYKCRPIANVFIDDNEGNPKIIGYVYRIKTTIENKPVKFDAWITIKEVIDYPIEDLEGLK